tara:strand:+ start:1779 stop:1967 length:189 start_codon:yes stop_codon:yes gene_type:complete
MSNKKRNLNKMLRDFNKKRESDFSREEMKGMLRDEIVKMNRLVMRETTDKMMFKYFRDRKKK